MNIQIKLKCSILMFLQYLVWGTWYVTLGTYLMDQLQVDALQVGSAYATFSIAALVSPFIVGLIADRYFAPNRVLAVLHFVGAVLFFWMSRTSDFDVFWWLLFLYTLCYTPSIALANAVCFRNLADPEKDFPRIRVWGTIGWIVCGLLMGYMNLEKSPNAFLLGAAISVILGAYSLFIPAPGTKNRTSLKQILGVEALGLLKDRSFFSFFLCSILICIPLTFYYNFANPFLNDIGLKNAAAVMTLGQGSEILFMLLLPLLFARLGVKAMLSAAIVAWIMRYILFANGDVNDGMWMLLLGIILHGACYDFFFVTGQIYTERRAGEAVKNAAQGLFTFATYGVGMLAGSYVSGYVTEQYARHQEGSQAYDWQQVWMVPAVISVVILVILLLSFKDRSKASVNTLSAEPV